MAGAACPACGAPVDDPWCASCGLELGGPEADELRALEARVAAAEAELDAAWVRHDALARQLASRRWRRVKDIATPSPPAPTRPAAAASSRAVAPEWNVERVRNLLLWTGATLLALSALTFTAVAWAHLGPAGRAALLIALTFVVGACAAATRRRLPATSGALTGLAVALALIDWQILRRAGVAPGLSGAAWWALGTAIVAVLSLGFGRVAGRTPTRRAAALLLPASAVLTIASTAGAAWSAALGLSMLAAGLVAADGALAARTGDPVVRGVLRIEATTSWIAAAIAVLVAAFEPQVFAGTLAPAAVMLSLALAPAAALARIDRRAADRTALAVLVLLSFLGAALTLPSTAVGPVGLLTLAAVLGCCGLVGAPVLADPWRRAAQVVGVSVTGIGVLVAGSAALVAELGPTAWLGAPWSGAMSSAARHVVSGPDTNDMPLLGWCAVVTLAAVAVTIPLGARGRTNAATTVDALLMRAAAGAVLLLALAIVPVAAGASVLVACTAATAEVCLLLVAAPLVVRDRPERALAFGWLAIVPAIPAAGWAAMTSTASIVVLAVVAIAAAGAVVIGRVDLLRAAHAAVGASAVIALAAVATLAAGAAVPTAGFVAATTAAVLLVTGSQLRRERADGIALEITGVTGIIVGALMAAPSTPWLAGTLTVAVPFLAAAGLRAHRRVEYNVLAAAAALGATWAWLAAADVSVVEAYTLPAAVAALAAGTFASRDARARSWLTLGPAITLALGPTLALAISRNDDWRAIAVSGAAVVVLLAGAHRRLQAPIVLGAAALVVLGIDKLGPPAARLPRWTMLALAGSLLLWVGTTFERRRADVQRAVRGFERLG